MASIKSLREKAAREQAPSPREKYVILDKNATHLGPLAITREMRKDGIDLTASEAEMFVHSGTIALSSAMPADGSAETKTSERVKAETAKSATKA